MRAALTIPTRLRRLGPTFALTAAVVLTPAATLASVNASPAAVGVSTAGSKGSSVRVARPSGVAAGDLLVATVAARAPVGANTAAPAGWKLLRRDTCTVPGRKPLTQAIYLRVATSAEPATLRWTVGRATGMAAGITAYRGVETNRPVHASGGRVSRNGRLAFAPSVSHGAGSLVAVFYGRTGRIKVVHPAGTTRRFLSSSAHASTLAVEFARAKAGKTGRMAAGSVGRVACNIGQSVVLRSSVRTPAEDPPPPTGPPTPGPPQPPPPSGPGTTLTFTDTYWRCTQPIHHYAVHGLPLRVVMLYTRPVVPPNAGAVQFGDGCVGDGTPATDVVLDIRGDGRTYGPGDDAIRIMAGANARDLEIEGRADCGPRQGASHQDGVQVLGGINITFRNFEIGDYDGGRATCQGAGGAFFYSLSSTNVDVEGGKFIACNHALLAGTASPGAEIRNASFRTGRDPVCVQEESFSASEPCEVHQAWRNGGGTTSGLICQRWNGSAWVNG